MSALHLWEIGHPYYATEGCFYAPGNAQPHQEYASWRDFHEECGDDDLDMNLVYRWDWHGPDEDYAANRLDIFFIGQRKALPRSVFVEVTVEDEPEIREWLKVRADHMRSVWEPLLDGFAA